MGFDLRVPIGGMFTLLGLILVGYGLMNGYRVDSIWGGVLVVFGVVMLIMARRSSPQSP